MNASSNIQQQSVNVLQTIWALNMQEWKLENIRWSAERETLTDRGPTEHTDSVI